MMLSKTTTWGDFYILTLSNLSNVPHLQSLLLPPALRELIGVSGNALQQIELPATLQRITGCHDWEVTSLSLPASLEVIEDMGYMPRLQSVNLAACTKLVVCTDFMDACPLLKEVDFSATFMRKFTGLGTIFVPSGVVVTGGSRYESYSYVGIEKVKFPSTLQTLEAFEHAKNLARLDLSALTLNDSPELTNCDIYGNQLQTLDLSGCPQLNWLEAGENRLESVSLPEASRLANLFLNDNNLSTLDVTSMPALRRLRVGGNKLRSIDLRPCSQLEEAFLADNLLTEAQFPSGKVWIDINENPGAFSFFTPELYETYCQKGGELTIKMKVDEDYVKRTSVLDLPQEFTANEWTSATQVEFRCNGNVYQPQREGYKYCLQRGAHTVNLTNANHPALTAFAWFDVPNDYTGIENAEVQTPTFAWNAAGELILSGLTAGDKVTLYDLQGRLLVEQTAATRQSKFHISRSASVLLLRIQQANRVIKHKLVRGRRSYGGAAMN